MEIILQYVSVFVTLVSIYLALKWAHLSCISENYRSNKVVPLALVVLAIAVDAVAYFVANYEGAMYLGIMLLFALPFVIKKKDDKA